MASRNLPGAFVPLTRAGKTEKRPPNSVLIFEEGKVIRYYLVRVGFEYKGTLEEQPEKFDFLAKLAKWPVRNEFFLGPT